jgi:branched-chain amino acid transport system ATP-binding protein
MPLFEEGIEAIQREHRLLGSVLVCLQRVADDVVESETPPDFALIASILHYIDVFPERFHHPKEKRFLINPLRLRHPACADLLDRIEDEHATGDSLLVGMMRCLLAFQAGESGGDEAFRDATEAFVDFHFRHMQLEEEQLLPLAREHLIDADWTALAGAFHANDDPLFGTRSRNRFEGLRRHIEKLAPQSLQKFLRDVKSGDWHPVGPN